MSQSDHPIPDKNLTIAIVEDENSVQMAYTASLKTQGYEVISFKDGVSAKEGLADTEVALIVMDLRLPEMDGLELSWRLRKAGNKTPILLCSAHIDSQILYESLRLGIIDFAVKPISQTDFQSKVSEILLNNPEAADRQKLRTLLINEDQKGYQTFLKDWRSKHSGDDADPLIKIIDAILQALRGLTKKPSPDMIKMLTSDLSSSLKPGKGSIYAPL